MIGAVVALRVQLLACFLVQRFVRRLPRDVADGKLASGTFLAAIAISLGLLNAACMTC